MKLRTYLQTGRALLALLLLLAMLPLTGSAGAPLRAAVIQQAQSPLPRDSAPKAGIGAVGAAPLPQFSAAQAAALVTELDVNGLKVLIKRRAGSQTVAAGLFIRGGSRNLSPQNAGIEALMLEASEEASEKFPRELMRTELARMGTAIGAGVNHDYSTLSLATTRANFDRSWDIFTDVALHPTFSPDDVERTRQRLLAGLLSERDEPDSFLESLEERAAYAGHPYLNRPQGSAETIGRFTPQDLRNYHQHIMQTSRLLLVIVGDLDAAKLRERIAVSLGKLPRGDYQPSMPPQLSFNASSLAVTRRDLPLNYIRGAFAAPPLTAADIYPMRIASSILQDRVFMEVRVKRNLSYAPESFLESQGANIGGIYVTSKDANQAIRVMLAEITRLQREPIDQQEINSAISGYLTNYYLKQETNAAQAGELAMYELIGGGWRNSLLFLDRLRAVTPADVQRVAQKYMRNIQFVVLGDPAQIDKNVFVGSTTE